MSNPEWNEFFKTRFEKISTKDEYDSLTATGLAYVVEPELEDTWEEFCIAKREWLNERDN